MVRASSAYAGVNLRAACVRVSHALFAFTVLIPCMVLLSAVASASAASPGPGWSIRSIAQPTNFSPGDEDRYVLLVTNVGSQPSDEHASVTIADTLPSHMHVIGISGRAVKTEASLTCTPVPLQCVGGAVAAGETLAVEVNVSVEAGSRAHEECDVAAISPEECNIASVSGGGAPAVSTAERTTFTSVTAPFEVEDFAMQAFDEDGFPSTQAGAHPYTIATSLYFSSEHTLGKSSGAPTDHPVEEAKDVVVDLPSGFIGNPQAIPKCPLSDLLEDSALTECPQDSRIGTFVFEITSETFRASEGGVGSEATAVYNMQPEPGFPAEFGFTFLGKPVYLYANSVRIGGKLGLRVTVPGLPEVEMDGATLLFFGDPAQHFGEGVSAKPFLTNSDDCEAASPPSATVEVDTWQHPGYYHEAASEGPAYPQLTGCNLLQFQPTLGIQPETTQADEPSGYTFAVGNPQSESAGSLGTPDIRNATVTLPAGLSLSPSAADGLRGCPATGPEGINIGSGETAETGRDVGNPLATEIGEGHPGGSDPASPYDDGLYHTAPGHCPAASTVGTVEVETPLLTSPLEGHVYVAQPECGGSGQPGCTEADALDGGLFKIYLEASGSGSILKLEGVASVDPATGLITTTFSENPQVPFSALKLHFNDGPRAPLANPLQCGPASASADFSAWSAPQTPDSQVLSPPFTVDMNGAGEACPPTPPLTPSLVAGTTNQTAAAFTTFSLVLSRADRQQDVSQLAVTTPPGLLARIGNVALCAEPHAAQGVCPAASKIGTVTVAVGPGPDPYWVTGQVYLTGAYNGAPFGLSIVVPAQAGPFNLGNVVVRSAITVNPNTSAVTITSTPLPQVIDGVPLRMQTLSVDVEHQEFMFNPTNCEHKEVLVTVAGAQGASRQLASPFAAAGCGSLPFTPTFTASTQAKTSKANGASLDVHVSSAAGQANIKSAAVTLPKQLPARLTTIQQACLAATFEVNPAACPAGSLIGVVQASSPVLPVALSGPAYLVSFGNAAFPDVVAILQGEGVRVDLTGNINIVNGITSSTFASVPDAPVTSFEFNLPESPHSALATDLPSKDKGSLCGVALTMPTTLIGQNGKQLSQKTQVAVGGCPATRKTKTKVKKKKVKKEKAKRHSAHGRRKAKR
jgi:hypothetical protein